MGQQSRPRSSASATEKRLARTVAEGRAVTILFGGDLMPLTGWVIGWDAYNWIVLDESCAECIVHKASAALIKITDRVTEDADDNLLSMAYEVAVAPFRAYLRQNGFVPAHLREMSSC